MQIIHLANTSREWWREAVIYQIYPRSFASFGGGVGDLQGITSRLSHVADLGAHAIWLSPFYKSPQKDGGYDVADYRAVDPIFGNLNDAKNLIARAHELGLRVIVDLVPNHTSDQHEWFQAALADPSAPERDLYWFRKADEAPTDWLSVFGGSAWTRVCDRADAKGSPWDHDDSWYLHLFDPAQPDLNWAHPRVREEFTSILRFWLDLGADGFRVDVAHGLVKDPSLPNYQYHWDMVSGGDLLPADVPPPPQWNQPGVHDIYREWRAVLDEYEGDRALVAEAWLNDPLDAKLYVRSDEMSQAFNFDFLTSPFELAEYREVIANSLREMDSVGAPTTWVLSNHDVVRAASRFGLSKTGKGPNGIRPFEEQPDPELGRRRALAAHALGSALPGSIYIYQGEELSLPEHMALPDELREDPAFFRTKGAEAGRDGCRVPIPWEADYPAFGFSPAGSSWLPQPEEWKALAVDVQLADEASSLNFFRKMYRLREELGLGRAQLADAEDSYLHYVSSLPGRDDLHIVTAFDDPVPLPKGAKIVLSSDEVAPSTVNDEQVAPNSTVWYTL
ncbi:MAG: glycoside hydrolase family 13 protein [Actinomycetaceae bacterium]|nr:glycoside hydrolase family 13 protein [Actinomycetaceae bacterium]